MGKPRLIILIRHAQSEGNKNRSIHQLVPDHRVRLTDDGWRQAEDAGRRLRALLKPDDTLQIFTSPYRRTRETTEGLLKTLTARTDPGDPDATPSPFSRSKIKVFEEPRLREQDFGNFQPSSAEMEKMWRERADYGHFFYRIPNGESAADAYDRVSGFNESLWRQFGENDFPSVCVLVTHGLMTRVFLMKWYHWSVEYFEDLRNINHCEFILMKQNADNGKYVLDNHLRTWSELKRQKAQQARAEEARNDPQRRNTLSSFLTQQQESPQIPPRKWSRSSATSTPVAVSLPSTAEANGGPKAPHTQAEKATTQASENKASEIDNLSPTSKTPSLPPPSVTLPYRTRSGLLEPGRDGGGTASGANTPHEMSSDDDGGNDNNDNYFPTGGPAKSIAAAFKKPSRKPTPEDIERWANESGMGSGRMADALGDEPNQQEEEIEEDLAKAEMEDRGIKGSVY